MAAQANKAASWLDGIAGRVKSAEEAIGGYPNQPLPDGLARQVLEYLASSGAVPGRYTAKPRGKSATGRTTEGIRFDTDIPVGKDAHGNPVMLELRGTVKWPV